MKKLILGLALVAFFLTSAVAPAHASWWWPFGSKKDKDKKYQAPKAPDAPKAKLAPKAKDAPKAK